jgi:ribosomal protein S21
MGIEVKKQERETTQSLIRRFTKRVQKSGVLRRARDSRFHKRSKSRQMKKRAALRREQLRKEYQKLKKLGLMEKK